MHPSPVTDLRTFLPTKDPELSKKFYTDLGFTINWSNEQIAELQIGFPVPAADFLGRSACRQFHDEPECRRCQCLVGAHPAFSWFKLLMRKRRSPRPRVRQAAQVRRFPL